MKKIKILFFILTASVLLISACGDKTVSDSLNDKTSNDSYASTSRDGFNVPPFPDGIEEEPPSGLGFTITNEEIFETGYYVMHYDLFGAGVFWETTGAEDSDIEWKVYFTDEELTDEGIEELSKTEPISVNDGSEWIKEGQWIYVICSVNSKTASEPEDSTFRLYSFRDYI